MHIGAKRYSSESGPFRLSVKAGKNNSEGLIMHKLHVFVVVYIFLHHIAIPTRREGQKYKSYITHMVF